MKCAIITIHAINNFGSVFQAYALNRFINQYYESTIIDYNPDYFKPNTLKYKLANLIFYKQYKIQNKLFNDFIKNNLKLTTNSYRNYKELKNNPPAADLFISGGDQLWNSYYDCGKDDAYKLKFTNHYKISYGTSLGRDNYTLNEMQSLKDSLVDYTSLSVRESSSIKLFNMVNMEVTQVVDPIFLLTHDDYELFIRKNIEEEKYAFIYLVESSTLLDDVVNYISNNTDMKIVVYSGMRKKCKCDKQIKYLDPAQVITYIKNAELVVSASFHATAFSVMFNKKFVTLLPGENTNARINDFLKSLDLENRIIKDNNNLSLVNENINYIPVNIKLEEKIRESRSYLLNTLKKIEGLLLKK